MKFVSQKSKTCQTTEVTMFYKWATEAIGSIIVFGVVFIFGYVFLHLLIDEDDPKILEQDRESFEREWEELCSK